MRRCLLAVFVLHLFWNMGGVAVVAPPHERTGDALGAPLRGSLAKDLSDGPQGLADQAHGLLDELPDMPDSVLRKAAARAAFPFTSPHAGRDTGERAAPMPDALFRPPRWV